MNTSYPRPKSKRWPFVLGLVFVLALIFFFTHSSQKSEPQAGQAAKKPVPVIVTPVVAQTMPLEIKTIGNVESISSVSLKPQTDGQITGIFFKEGDLVQKGQLLFTIDTQPIQASIAQAQATVSKDLAQVSQARAQLAKDQAQVRQSRAAVKRDQAQFKYAASQEQRYAKLLKDQYISQSEYEQTLASKRAAEETVLADQAALENSEALLSADQASIESAAANVRADQAIVESNRIKLSYCYVKAPFAGRTGSLKIRQGDTVKYNETPLVVINQVNPIYVGFSIPEQTMDSIKTATSTSTKPFSVTVKTRENPPISLNGRLNFMENTVDTTTGTIRLKAFFDNQNHLWPGQFVDVVLYLAEQPNALVIPSEAIQSGQNGDYVFVAEAGKAILRQVTVSRIINDSAVIQSGVKLGENVVTDGQFQLSPGALIHLKNALKSETH
jgi:multidrug efflux system membrane fusion protein